MPSVPSTCSVPSFTVTVDPSDAEAVALAQQLTHLCNTQPQELSENERDERTALAIECQSWNVMSVSDDPIMLGFRWWAANYLDAELANPAEADADVDAEELTHVRRELRRRTHCEIQTVRIMTRACTGSARTRVQHRGRRERRPTGRAARRSSLRRAGPKDDDPHIPSAGLPATQTFEGFHVALDSFWPDRVASASIRQALFNALPESVRGTIWRALGAELAGSRISAGGE
jgi:hypothetical protein